MILQKNGKYITVTHLLLVSEFSYLFHACMSLTKKYLRKSVKGPKVNALFYGFEWTTHYTDIWFCVYWT